MDGGRRGRRGADRIVGRKEGRGVRLAISMTDGVDEAGGGRKRWVRKIKTSLFGL